jgi:hypothetical protein
LPGEESFCRFAAFTASEAPRLVHFCLRQAGCRIANLHQIALGPTTTLKDYDDDRVLDGATVTLHISMLRTVEVPADPDSSQLRVLSKK